MADRDALFPEPLPTPAQDAPASVIPDALQHSIPRAVPVPSHPKAQPSPRGLPRLSLDLSVCLRLTVAEPFLPRFPGKVPPPPGELLGT